MRICMFLGVDVHDSAALGPSAGRSVEADPAWSHLSRAVRNAWDQTPEGAAKLARVVAAVADVSRR